MTNAELHVIEEQADATEQVSETIELSVGDLDIVGGGFAAAFG